MARLITIGNIEIRVFPVDHLPPHFHIISPDHSALIVISDLSIYSGELTPQMRRRVWGWIVDNHALIVAEWNRLHPNFPV